MRGLLQSFVLRCVLIGLLLLGLFWVVVSCHFGSTSIAIAYFNGADFVVSPSIVDLGDCESGSRSVATFTAVNFSAKPMRLVGCETECSCIALDNLPVTVGPHESRNVSVRVLVGGKGEVFSQPVILYIESTNGQLESVVLPIRARINPAITTTGLFPKAPG